ELPLVARNEPAGPFAEIPFRKRSGWIVEIDNGIRQKGAVTERKAVYFLVGNEVGAHETCDWPARVTRDRNCHAHERRLARDVELPANPCQRESLLKQKSVSKLACCARVERRFCAAESRQQTLAAAIADFEKKRTIPFPG